MTSSETLQGETPPGPPGLPLLGNALELGRDPLAFYEQAWRQYGDVVIHRLGPILAYLVVHPDSVERVLRTNHQNYVRGTVVDERGVHILGRDSILMTEGPPWRSVRDLMQPAFEPHKLQQFFQPMAAAASSVLEDWSGREPGTDVRIDLEMLQTTMSIMSRTIFGTDLRGKAEGVTEAVAYLLQYLRDAVFAVLFIPPSVPTPKNLRFRRAMATVSAFLQRCIETHSTGTDGDFNLLSHLVEAVDPASGQRLTDSQVRDQVLSVYVAGQENVAALLTWTWYLLSRNPEVEAQLHREVDEVLDGQTPGPSDLSKLVYTRRVLEESLRIYPPLWAFVRRAERDDEIGGYRIAGGSSIVLSPYLTQRHPEIWADPEVFDPGRFTPERSSALPRYAFFPFAGGLHKCLGNEFTIQAAQVVLSSVARRFCLRLAPGQDVSIAATAVIRPAHGIRMTLHPR